MELKDVLRAARSGWRLLLAGTLLGLAVAGAVTWLTPPQYQSSTQLFLSTDGSADTSPVAVYRGILLSQQRVASYAELLKGQRFAGQVIDDLHLHMTPAQLSERITVAPVPETVILQVTVTADSALQAQAIADSIGRQFSQRVASLETPAGTTTPTAKVTVVEPASLDRQPVSPDRTVNLIRGAEVGLVIGLALALISGRRNTARAAASVNRSAEPARDGGTVRVTGSLAASGPDLA